MVLPYSFINQVFWGHPEAIYLSGMALVLLVLSGIFLPFHQFGYLYQKSKVDMTYALPVTKKQLFFCDFFSGLSIYLVPYALQVGVYYILYGIGTATRANIVAREFMFGQDAMLVLKIFFVLLMVMIFTYVLTVFTLTCTGSMFEAFTAPVYTNLCLFGIVAIVGVLCFKNLQGINYDEIQMELMQHISPMGGVWYLHYVCTYDNITWLQILGWAGIYTCVMLAFFFFSYRIFVKRKAEDVSKPFVVNSLYYICITVLTLLIATITYSGTKSILNFIISSAVCYFLFEFIRNRGITQFKKSVQRYAITMVFILVFLMIVNKTETFGIEKRVTPQENLYSVTIDYPGFFFEDVNQRFKITLKDAKNIELITAFHQDKIDALQKDKEGSNRELATPYVDTKQVVPMNDYSGDYFDINIKYDVKHGIDYVRSYRYSYEERKKLKDLEVSEEFIHQQVASLEEYCNRISVSDIFESQNKILYNEQSMKTEEGKEFKRRFFEAYRNDRLNLTKKQYFESDAMHQYRVGCGFFSIIIDDYYVNTIQLLKEMKSLPDLNEISYLGFMKHVDIEFIKEDYANQISQNGSFALNGNYDDHWVYDVDEFIPCTNKTEQLNELLKVARTHISTEEKGDIIFVNTRKYVIPSKYHALYTSVVNQQ